jgi:hypothetical protein
MSRENGKDREMTAGRAKRTRLARREARKRLGFTHAVHTLPRHHRFCIGK